MEVVLLRDVPKLGQVGEIKKVSPGYARNYLLVRHLAVYATPKSVKAAESRRQAIVEKAEQQLSQCQDNITKLEKLTLRLKRKATDGERLFAAIDKKCLIGELQAKGLKVEEKQLILLEPIKQLGEYQVEVEYTKEIKGKFKVMVEKE